MIHSRTFWRLFGTFGLFWLAAIGLLGIVIVRRVENHYLQQIEQGLRTKAILVREMIRSVSPNELDLLQERVVELKKEIETRITILAPDGRVLAESDRDPRLLDNHANRPEVLGAREARVGTATRHSKTIGFPMMYVALRTDDVSPVIGYVRVSVLLDSVQNQLAELNRIVWTAAAVSAVAGLVLAFWLARQIIFPLQELTRGAEHIAAGNYGHKVATTAGDEIGALARAFNHMSEQLVEQFGQLDEDRQQLRTILSGMIEGVIALDPEQRILFANERAALLLGFPNPVTAGRKLWEVVRQRPLQEIVERSLNGSEPYQEEVRMNGSPAKSLTVYAARLPGSAARGAVLVIHDTTELRRLERLRQEFVANVSHELKTPLSVIKVCSETLLDGAGDDPARRQQFLERIDEQAHRLHALILDLLSLARIESGEEAFDFEAVSIRTVVAECLERVHAQAKAKNQTLEARAAEGASEVTAWVDQEAFGQILDNLVDNALKYTPTGGHILVSWQVADGQVCLQVCDDGIGIPERDLPRIFERFYRVDKARSRELGGTGLGLSIVKHLVQAMNGSVEAHSKLGQGTTFSVRLPQGRTT